MVALLIPNLDVTTFTDSQCFLAKKKFFSNKIFQIFNLVMISVVMVKIYDIKNYADYSVYTVKSG